MRTVLCLTLAFFATSALADATAFKPPNILLYGQPSIEVNTRDLYNRYRPECIAEARTLIVTEGDRWNPPEKQREQWYLYCMRLTFAHTGLTVVKDVPL